MFVSEKDKQAARRMLVEQELRRLASLGSMTEDDARALQLALKWHPLHGEHKLQWLMRQDSNHRFECTCGQSVEVTAMQAAL